MWPGQDPLAPPSRRAAAFLRAVTWRGARRAAGVGTRYEGPAAAPDVFCRGARREGVSGGAATGVAATGWAGWAGLVVGNWYVR